MTNFLLKDPDAVFIHIKKAGGTAIRSLWPAGSARRASGHVPPEWAGLPAFAIVRHPEARFLSAVRMFKYGVDDQDSAWAKPLLPGLTISGALDILEDDQVPFDRSVRTPEAGLKHHILPQTHPFCCLHEAGTILRFERLAEEYPAFAATLGLPAELPLVGRSRTGGPQIVLTDADRTRFRRLFARDFELLGYDPDDAGALRPIQPLPVPPPSVHTLWPALFSDRKITAARAASALPAAQADLAVFRDTPVRGTPGPTWPRRRPNLVEHFRALMPEFAGQSFLALLLAATIVVVRRPGDATQREAGLAQFFRVLEFDGDRLLAELNLRWLTSVADTLADHGRTDAQRALGLAGSLLANTVKLYETERAMFTPHLPWPPRRQVRKGGALPDGMICFGIARGDMPANLHRRVALLSGSEPLAGALLAEIDARVRRNDTAYARLAQLSGKPRPPLMPGWRRRALESLARWLAR